MARLSSLTKGRCLSILKRLSCLKVIVFMEYDSRRNVACQALRISLPMYEQQQNCQTESSFSFIGGAAHPLFFPAVLPRNILHEIKNITNTFQVSC